jgi:tetratricopeptide (TPR) repeat protein
MVPTTTAGPFTEKFAGKNREAEAFIASGDLSAAAALLGEIVENDAGNYRAFNNLGMICWAKKQWQDAFAMFRMSVEQRPDYADALANLFDAGLKLRRVAEVIPLLDEALQSGAPETIRTLRDEAVSLGTAVYRSDRAMMIGLCSAHLEEADRELEAGNESRAMELYLKSNDEEGPSAGAFCGLGIISFYQNRPHDAVRLFAESIRLNPTDPDTFLNLLESAAACGKTAQAREVFNLCRGKYPQLESIAAEFEKAADK